MNSIPEELLTIILSKLPIKTFTTFKLVCKQWDSILDSPYFRDLFHSTHQNSSWSLMSSDYEKEHIVQYRFNSWGLERSLGSYISSFLTKKFGSQRHKYRVWSYAEVGLILISEVKYHGKNRSLYVANPITHECIKIPSHNAHHKVYSWPLGITTRTEKGVVLDYKVVLYRKNNLLIYSSHTCLWSVYKTVYNPSMYLKSPIILHGTFHWVTYIIGMDEDVVVSFNERSKFH
ncbi:hypothetical protein CARUB_v10019309mg [Capsella rubella]|uniref:F-box domain-containing protein n=1 Tax=Capsella rubella TaxID=81985 RepID=R0FSU5_9BRAS|nr:hypothetical protein CARUB_v10019309mg [Capsella rubella]